MFNRGLWVGGAIATIGLLIGILSGPEPDECQLYNEMRAIWDESGHEYGWPEYETGKDEECGYAP